MNGIDVSENNGIVDWQAVVNNGYQFAIIRIGYGTTIDSEFYRNINGALDAGLKVGVYLYSYALNEDMARKEAQFVYNTLSTSGLPEEKLEMGVWFDMEDADNYKANHGDFDAQEITNMCSVFLNEMWRNGYTSTGIYANYDWMTNRIYTDQLGGCAKWLAQYNSTCDYYDENLKLWQYTDAEYIDGKQFDGNKTM